MKKLLILLSIFSLLSNSNVKPAARSDDVVATAQKKRRVESSESKEEAELKKAAQVGRYPDDRPKDREVLEQLAQQESLCFFPVGVLRLMLDYCKSKFEIAYGFEAHKKGVNSLIKLDRTHFASASQDGTIKIWQFRGSTAGTPEKFECIQILDKSNGGHNNCVLSLTILDETHFASCSNSEIKIWQFIPAIDSIPKCIHTLDHRNNCHKHWVDSLIIFNKTHFVSCAYDGTIKIWQYDSSTASVPTCIYTSDRDNNGHTNLVNSLLKLDEKHFVSCSYDSTIKIWEFIPETSTARCVYTLDDRNDGHTDYHLSLMKLDDNHFISCSDDKTIKIWQLIPGSASKLVQCRCIQTLNHANGGHIDSVNLLSKLDATHFISSSIDKTIKIWELIPGSTPLQYKCIQTLDHRNGGHTDWVKSLIKLDATHFISNSIDKTIKVWELIPGSTPVQYRCIQTLILDGAILSLIRMLNGDLIAGLNNGSMQVFKLVVDIE